MAQERRSAERVTVSIQAAFFAARAASACELRNLSSAGVLLRAPVHHLDDPRVKLSFDVPELEDPISIVGLAVRKRRSGLESEWGIQLQASEDGTIEAFESYVARTIAAETAAGRSPDRPLRVIEPPPALESLYDAALKQLDED